jgi:hypothetical protein
MLASGLDPKEGAARQEAQTYGSVSFAGYGGRLSARHMQRLFGTGPRFPVWASRSRLGPVAQFLFALSAFGLLERAPKSSASSWQGLLVVPEGAPAPPG